MSPLIQSNLIMRHSFSTNKPIENIKIQDIPKETLDSLSSEEFVKKGKEKLVGSWLLVTAGSVLLMILLGGYTRLSKSGLSMTKWKPIAYKYPTSQEEWDTEFENYKVFFFIFFQKVFFLFLAYFLKSKKI